MPKLNSKAVVGAVIVQGVILIISAYVFLVVLPSQGITGLTQIDTLESFRRVEGWLLLMDWMHFIFALGIGVVAYYVYQRISQRASRAVQLAIAIVLVPFCIFLIGHDLGFGLINWSGIAADPADTVFSADLQLLNARNVLFFALGAIVVLDVFQQRKRETQVSAA